MRTSETNVTLYYGVDASKRYDVVGASIPNRGSDKFMTNTVALAGKYCTDGGNCLTLEPGQTDPNPSGLVLDGKGSSDFFDQLTLCTYSQDISGCNPSSGGYYNAMKDFLIQGDTGAMELYAGFGLPVCGTTSYVGDGPTYCDGTSEKQVEDAVVASEIGDLATQTLDTVSTIDEIVGEVNSSVSNMTECLTTIMEFLEQTVLGDYEHFAQVGEQYHADADTFQQIMQQTKEAVDALEQHIGEISSTVSEINSMVEQSTDGISGIAEKSGSTQNLVTEGYDKLQECTQSVNVIRDFVAQFHLD